MILYRISPQQYTDTIRHTGRAITLSSSLRALMDLTATKLKTSIFLTLLHIAKVS